MKRLLAALLSVIVIASCSSPTSPDEGFEPKRIGYFNLVSPSSADYVGKSSAKQKSMSTASSDTVHIEQPNDHSLKLWKDSASEQGWFTMQFTDSTISKNDITPRDVRFDNPKGEDNYPMYAVSKKITSSTDYIEYELEMIYHCGSNFVSNNPIIFIKPLRDDGKPYKVYAIHVNGIVGTVEEIGC